MTNNEFAFWALLIISNIHLAVGNEIGSTLYLIGAIMIWILNKVNNNL